MKFLIVDDSATMRRILVNSLRRIGYEDTVEAPSGEEALVLFDSLGDIDFVITDNRMPNMGGIELTTLLKLRNREEEIPVLMVMSRSVREDMVEAARAGINNYIIKPFTPHILQEKIDQILVSING